MNPLKKGLKRGGGRQKEEGEGRAKKISTRSSGVSFSLSLSLSGSAEKKNRPRSRASGAVEDDARNTGFGGTLPIFSRARRKKKKNRIQFFGRARWPPLRVRRIGARMQIIVKAKYKGPIVSRYCAVAGKIKVAGPAGPVDPTRGCLPRGTSHTHVHVCIYARTSTEAHTYTRIHARAYGRPKSLG